MSCASQSQVEGGCTLKSKSMRSISLSGFPPAAPLPPGLFGAAEDSGSRASSLYTSPGRPPRRESPDPPRTNDWLPPSLSNEATKLSYILDVSSSSSRFFSSASSRAFWNRLFFCCPTANVASLLSLMVFSEPGWMSCSPHGFDMLAQPKE